MQTILVPTDYSIVAQMAVQYAAALANATRASLILFHAYHPTVFASDLPGGVVSSREEEKQHARKLNAIRRELEEAYQIEISCRVATGLAAEAVPAAAVETNASLIVMGTGRSRDLTKSVFGHVTTHVIGRTAVPLLIVPEGVAFEQPNDVVLAADFRARSSKVPLRLLSELVQQFGSRVHVLHVAKPLPAWGGDPGDTLVETRLGELNHVYEIVEDEDPARGIRQYIAENKPDWVVMLPHRYSFLKGMLHKSCTEQVAEHARIPVLVLPEVGT
jgi:nucleotide-binding universal stress UspA family protein